MQQTRRFRSTRQGSTDITAECRWMTLVVGPDHSGSSASLDNDVWAVNVCQIEAEPL